MVRQALTALSAVLAVAWATHRYAPSAAKKVYLLDTFTYKPPDRCADFACLVELGASFTLLSCCWQVYTNGCMQMCVLSARRKRVDPVCR